MKKGFTLSEVLITLAIVGVVAVLTLTKLVEHYQTKAWDTSATVFQEKLYQALSQMNIHGVLTGYSTTEEFVGELAKYIKIAKVCGNEDLISCFSDTVIYGDAEVDMTSIKTTKHIGQDDWKTNIVGVDFVDGTTGLIAYNPTGSCEQDSYSNKVDVTSCVALLYDTTGHKRPNKNGKDLRGLNILKLSGVKCMGEFNDMCFVLTPYAPTAHKWKACSSSYSSSNPEDQEFMKKYGMNYCYPGNDYWAGAVKQCKDAGGRMPTQSEISEIAKYVLNGASIVDTYNTNTIATLNTAKAAELGFQINPSSNAFGIWSDTEMSNKSQVYYRIFYSDRSVWSYQNRYNDSKYIQAVCIAD